MQLIVLNLPGRQAVCNIDGPSHIAPIKVHLLDKTECCRHAS